MRRDPSGLPPAPPPPPTHSSRKRRGMGPYGRATPRAATLCLSRTAARLCHHGCHTTPGAQELCVHARCARGAPRQDLGTVGYHRVKCTGQRCSSGVEAIEQDTAGQRCVGAAASDGNDQTRGGTGGGGCSAVCRAHSMAFPAEDVAARRPSASMHNAAAAHGPVCCTRMNASAARG